MKKIIKYGYLLLGLIHYIIINYISYTISPYKESYNIGVKILFSLLSFMLLLVSYYIIIKFDIFENKKYKLKKETKVFIYIFVIIVSLVSLIN